MEKGNPAPVAETDRLCILLAWLAGELSEGTVERALGTDRLTVRKWRLDAIRRGIELARRKH